MNPTSKKTPDLNKPAASSTFDWLSALTLAAFVLALGLVACRSTMMEVVREASINTGKERLPQGPAATTTLILDLITWLPLLLILIRRAIDPTYILRLHWSHGIMLLLGIWTACSVMWSSDKFLAIVNASKWIAGLSLVFSASQLVRSWQRMRVVGGLCGALAMVYIMQAGNYRIFDHPALVENWNRETRQQFIADNPHLTQFQIEQYDRKVKAGEMLGFFTSPNTFAAMTALCVFAVVGLMIQRYIDDDEIGFAAALGVIVVLSLVVIYLTDSRTAMGGVVLTGILLAIVWRFRAWIISNSRKAYFGGWGVVLLGALGVIGLGLATGKLVHISLTFRWWYWNGAAGVLLDHPILGVGWGQFGSSYLAHRLPTAIEEIKDPHNFIVRFFSELGIVGGLLAIAWLVRMSYEANAISSA